MSFKIYTKTGDAGETALFGGRRLPKSDLRIEAYGTVDELNSYIGLVRDCSEDAGLRKLLKNVQERLFSLGTALATDPAKNTKPPDIHTADIEVLEKEIDVMEAGLPPLKNFILPGGHTTVSFCHIARCICRRAERLVVALNLAQPVDPILIKYLNRLSDFLFVLARHFSQKLGAEEIIWNGR